uniref:Uncharacterized protein n=1 Tax=Panagrolaimus sp. JU765 TaxID=591449 RepID=A0AC34RKK7_9BILA
MSHNDDKGILEQAKEGIQNAAEKTKEKLVDMKNAVIGEKSSEDKARDNVKETADKAADKVSEWRDKAGDKIEDMGHRMQHGH